MNTIQKNYFRERLQKFGIAPSLGPRYGLYNGGDGSIHIVNRNLHGESITFVPQFGDKRAAYKKAMNANKRTQTERNLNHLYETLTTVRHTPQQVKKGLPRYKIPSVKYSGFSPIPMPTNGIIKSYQDKEALNIVVGVEGYFKALSLDLNGVPSFSFSGNTTYKLDDILKHYLLECKPKNFVAFYDGDLFDLFGHKKKEIYSDSRVRGFYNSAVRFAKQFFTFCQENELKIKLHFCAVNPLQKFKGVDDLLNGVEHKQPVIDAFNSLKTSPFFIFQKLYKTSYELNLKNAFNLNSHKNFYFKHGVEIGDNVFKFQGANYQKKEFAPVSQLEIFQPTVKPVIFFELLNNPFFVDIDTYDITVDKYLSEARADVEQLLKKYKRLAINAPTGCGKTTYFLDIAKRLGLKIAITVPTRNLAEQLKNTKYDVCSIYGTVTPKKKEQALNSQIVVCTYDTLKHINLENRILIVDESHNLVNQYGQVLDKYIPFRAKTMRTVLECIDKAKQTVLISGTTNKLLCKELDFHYVNVKRKTSNKINVHHIEASRKCDQVAVLLEQLENEDWQNNDIRFVYLNSNDKLNQIKNYLIKKGLLDNDDIEIITRTEINSGNSRVLNEIMSKAQTITSPVKLVLCSCLIAEGISIKNKNIGNLYTVNIKCLDSFRQFVARFRSIPILQVYAITAPEKVLKNNFFREAETELLDLNDMSKTQCKIFTRNKDNFLNDYDNNDLEFIDQIKPTYDYNSDLANCIYVNDEGEARADTLRMLAAIRERKLKESNNAFFFSQLLKFDNFMLNGCNAEIIDPDIDEELKESKQELKEQKEQALNKLKSDLLSRPCVVVSAYYIHAKKGQNRHLRSFIEETGSEFVNDDNGQDYLSTYKDYFSKKWFTKLIKDFLRMNFIDVGNIGEELEKYNPSDFSQRWKAFNTCVDLALYQNKYTRKHLTNIHKFDIKAKAGIKAAILQNIENDTISTEQLTKTINSLFERKRYNSTLELSVIERITYANKEKSKRLLKELFEVDEVNNIFTILKVYDLQNGQKNNVQNSPFLYEIDFSKPSNLLKMLQLKRE